MTRERRAKDAADAFQLLRAFRSLDLPTRRRVVEIVEAMTEKEAPANRGRRPSYSRTQLRLVQEMLAKDVSDAEIAKATGLSRSAVYRIRRDPAGAEAALARWGAVDRSR
ncbi:hypothetical protein AS156_09950 [Bradyrhizobium macuxiense]|uniref:Resolvase HTH domain-containing protein n=1 Tax=Bradyrhizobium macuxiense TaxID=1755647 RepID=A0A120FLX5_9BRAD|nr:helix-turn-helix domain-containing protein [Bradyrhizobium macuxiense]KWV52942.1 hypothetical protein AS156_09950 [Bradyrhizobium macuxiense]